VAYVKVELIHRGGCRWLWLGERELRAKKMRVRSGQYWLPFLPDAYFEVAYPNGDVQCVIVEIDMGTLTLRRFARKMQAFETALDDDVFRRHFKRDDFEVLVLNPTDRQDASRASMAPARPGIVRHGGSQLLEPAQEKKTSVHRSRGRQFRAER
jgi:hypothetical protein